MPERKVDIRGGRLCADDYVANFRDIHPALSPHEAAVEADRCYFCHDAPCIAACPTGIDIPLFIRQIATGNREGAAKTILDQNIFGGICARVCPTETLCEQGCVREEAEGKPVRIGLLQRFATDALLDKGRYPYERAPATGRRVAVVGAGPAGLSCAHRLARHGHEVVVFEARDKPGGLNEYGIAAYKTVDGFAQREVEMILALGGIELRCGVALGRDVTLEELRRDHDAVFLALGLAGVNALGIEGEERDNVGAAIDYIARLRQTDDYAKLPVGRRIVVIGGGMTAIDIATQTRALGAEDVTIVYRRGPERMSASQREQALAQTRGVRIKHNAVPRRVIADNGAAVAVEFDYAREENGRLVPTGETFVLEADMVFRAIGQTLVPEPFAGAGLAIEGGKIRTDAGRFAGVPGIWAGGDCALGGEDLTVVAVEDGKVAAESIHRYLAEL